MAIKFKAFEDEAGTAGLRQCASVDESKDLGLIRSIPVRYTGPMVTKCVLPSA